MLLSDRPSGEDVYKRQVFAMYILLQKEKLGRQAKKVLFAFVRKGRAEAALEVLALTYKTFSSFLTGQCVEALILGSMFVIAMTLLRLPYALLTGIVIAFTALIPIFGAFIGCAVGAFLIFMVSPVQALIFIVLLSLIHISFDPEISEWGNPLEQTSSILKPIHNLRKGTR